jgi:SAM-dependent methyltransferase
MKIQLAGQRAARVLYTHCPLCEGGSLMDLRQDDCRHHPLYQPDLPATISWRGCETCGHIFTDGYFDEAGLASLFSTANPAQVPGLDTERHRPVTARIVDRVSGVRGALGGRWLDVGVGNGALQTTAEEFGYETVGLELREACAEKLRALGYDVRCLELESLPAEERFDVISMADVLEHVAFPAQTLQAAHERLQPGGLLFVSMPNVDTFVWRQLDEAGTNPYWAELEHYHNFSREHLYWLLRRNGFEPCHYAVSERYRAGMEVIAVRVEPDA